MLSAKSGNLSLHIEPTKLASDVVVSLSIKAKCDGCPFNRLAYMSECNCFPVGSEETCVCMAMFLKVRNVLAGSPIATEKSKVGAVYSGYSGNNFYITWHVKGNGSAISKSLRLALKSLTPLALYSTYQQLIRQLGKKPNREEFNYAASAIASSIKTLVHCAIIGNVKTKQEILDSMASTLQSKIPEAVMPKEKSAPKEHINCERLDKTYLDINGWHAAVFVDFMTMSKLQGIRTSQCGDGLTVNMPKDKLKNEVKKIKESVKAFVQSKYAMVKGDLDVVLGLRMLQEGCVSGLEVMEMIKKKVSAADVEKAINQALAKI